MSDLDTLPPLADASYEPAEATSPDVEPDAPKRTRRPRSDKGVKRGPRGSTVRSTKDKQLAEDLLGPWSMIVMALSIPMPTVAAVLSQRSEKSTAAIVALAPPKMKEALTKASKFAPAADLAQTIAMAFVAAMLDIGKLEPGSMVANMTGVQELFEMTHEPVVPEQTAETPNNVHPFPSTPVTTFSAYPGGN